MECGYRQLCIFAWRYFSELIAIAPRKDKGKERPQIKTINKQSWRRLAQLAESLGFDSTEITNLAKHNPDLAMVITFLNQVRPQEFYNQSNNGSSVNGICRILEGIEEQSSNVAAIDYKHVDVPLEYRCGRPFEKAYESSRARFFLFDLNSTFKNNLSHFSVQRDIFRAFFGCNFLPPLFEDCQTGKVSNQTPQENGQSSTQHLFSVPSGQFTHTSQFDRLRKTPRRRDPATRMNAIAENIVRGQESVDASAEGVSLGEQNERQASLKEEVENRASQQEEVENGSVVQTQEQVPQQQAVEQEQVNRQDPQSEEQISREQEQVSILDLQSEEQIAQNQTDNHTQNTQIEEPIPEEPETRQVVEIQNPKQPVTQTGNDEVEELFEEQVEIQSPQNEDQLSQEQGQENMPDLQSKEQRSQEAPHEKFSLPLGSQAQGSPPAPSEQRRNTIGTKEQNQEVTNVF